MKNKNLIPLLISLSVCLLFIWFSPWRIREHWLRNTPEKYQKELVSIREKRKQLAHQKANTQAVKTAFVQTINQQLFPHWYGTFWSFNGTTQTPGRGSIACGYFVTTVLRDAGLDINRSALAQMASEKMISSLVAEKYIQRFSNRSIGEFVEQIRQSGRGLYLVGLDNHTGFIVYDAAGVRFVHASGAYPFCVISETAVEASILKKSAYRIVGKISDDPVVLQSWVKA